MRNQCSPQTVGRGILVRQYRVVLHEMATVDIDEFTTDKEDNWRVLDLDDSNIYRVRLFRINKDNGNDEQIGSDIYPVMNGKPLSGNTRAITGYYKLSQARRRCRTFSI